MRQFASLQLFWDEYFEAAQERIIHAVTSYMEALGYTSCGHESAERTIAFARIKGGWAVFDDCADRQDMRALNGLARCLTLKLKTSAVGVMGFKDGFVLKLYKDGALLDTFNALSGQVLGKGIKFLGRAIRWRTALGKDIEIRELSAAFQSAKTSPDQGFERLRELLFLDASAGYGFSSIEDAGLQGVVWMYFNAPNRIRQRWYEKLLHLPTRCGGAAPTAFSHQKECRQRH